MGKISLNGSTFRVFACSALLSAFPIVKADEAGWRQDAEARIERLRMGEFTLRLETPEGAPVSAEVRLRQTRSHFHFGAAVSHHGLDPDYENHGEYVAFILEHFNTLVAENAMKWYHVERERGRVRFENADALVAFAEEHDLAVRGHCLFWDVPRWVEVQEWLPELGGEELQRKVEEHLERMASRYAGRLIAWDVNNEMLDGGFYEERLGPGANAWFFRETHRIDPETPLFVNEFMILEDEDKTGRYIELIEQLRNEDAPVHGIGIQDHFAAQFADERDPEKVLRNLDRLAEPGLPIHITELSFNHEDPEVRARALEKAFTLLFSHPAVEAILLWGFHGDLHWLGGNASLLEEDWTPNPAGRVLRELLLERWRTRHESETGEDGDLRFRGFHGSYEVEIITGDKRITRTVEFTPGKHEVRMVLSR